MPPTEKFGTDGLSNQRFDKRRFDCSKSCLQERREHLDTSQIPRQLR
jgi:hypothetical protein